MPKKQKRSNTQSWLWVALGAAVVVAAAIWLGIGAKAGPEPIDGIRCEAMEGSAQHIHANLNVYVRGERRVVPALIGIKVQNRCFYWVHTHDTSGMIHVESPDKDGAYTLGNLFDIWGKPFDATHLFGETAKADESVKAWVDGQPYDGDLRAITFKDHEVITLELGPPWPAPVTDVDFSAVG